ncbi:cupin domain-containing protein [Nioella aestuarii]|uniref:cupin domain-containing protein n=1 Tax=Nioella aestuarii TaxID=1662864 RepID=UPI003D7F585A
MKDLSLGPDSIEWAGTVYRTILATSETSGSMSIVDSVSPPNYGPPRHIHHDADETFVILSGEVELWLEGETTIKGPGETAFIPRGREHTFRVIGTQPSRHLVILTPGGFEGFFSDMAAGQFRIPEDMEQINESAARHHLEFTGPPLGA